MQQMWSTVLCGEAYFHVNANRICEFNWVDLRTAQLSETLTRVHTDMLCEYLAVTSSRYLRFDAKRDLAKGVATVVTRSLSQRFSDRSVINEARCALSLMLKTRYWERASRV
ncbi:MAG: hypothetical protein ACKESB_01130 [Candidatus Hodgkinia cicadicola]